MKQILSVDETKDIKKQLLEVIDMIDKFETVSIDMNVIPSGSSKLIDGSTVMVMKKIELRLTGFSGEYQNPELKDR